MNFETLIPFLEKLSQKLGVGADQLWSAYMIQTKIYGICTLAAIIFFCLLGGIGFRVAYRFKNDDSELFVFIGVFSCLTLVGSILGFGLCLSDIMAAFFNPEYLAAKSILEDIAGNCK